MKILFLLLFTVTTTMSQVKLEPFIITKDTTQNAYRYWTNHPNGWDGGHQEFKGIDTLRIFRTYVVMKNDSILLAEKKIYLTKPKGSDDGYTNGVIYIDDLIIKPND